eukprot:CAMPEP_0179115500 /NCGR_PEP_ID=MMETSP0796-20121207/54131_1 /TAXON_ID=73915 /ORGANISM="Pyrodinium bahamense, Strain pbaha01" /LENGTH=102 /DNA_ID=CAMNT_0020813751 /DNA_START=137 /DNA_END=445 /DNA_ORIENTATION=-
MAASMHRPTASPQDSPQPLPSSLNAASEGKLHCRISWRRALYFSGLCPRSLPHVLHFSMSSVLRVCEQSWQVQRRNGSEEEELLAAKDLTRTAEAEAHAESS